MYFIRIEYMSSTIIILREECYFNYLGPKNNFAIICREFLLELPQCLDSYLFINHLLLTGMCRDFFPNGNF